MEPGLRSSLGHWSSSIIKFYETHSKYVSLLLFSLLLPIVTIYYVYVVFSMSIFSPPIWITDYILPAVFLITPILTPLIFNYLLFKCDFEDIYSYIAELNSSIFVFVTMLIPGSFVFGPDIFSHSGTFRLHTTGFILAYILLVLFGSLGLLFSNARFIYRPIKSLTKKSFVALKTVFIPPYGFSDVSFENPVQPSLEDDIEGKRSFLTGIVAICGIWALAAMTQHFGKFEMLLEGHMSLIWHLQDIFSGDPEKALSGWTGGLEQLVTIFNPFLFLSYLLIIFLALSFASSWIFATRHLQERIRNILGISKLSMATLSTVASFPLLVIAYYLTQGLIMYASAVFSFLMAHS